MNEMLQIELTAQERDVLLRGLRYVRSSLMLEMRDPTPEDSYERSRRLDALQNLYQRLESTDPAGIHV